MTEEEARASLQSDVSRETFDRLECYVALLIKWQKAINLVSQSTIRQIWTRHILDSAQIFNLQQGGRHWVDMGSGGGFPGLVCAAMAKATQPEMRFTLIESDTRKSAFLRTAASEMGLDVAIIAERIEKVAPQKADILSARALASLTMLCEFALRHLAPNGTALFPKGANYQSEIDEALATWQMTVDAAPSKTATEAVILKIEGLKRG